MPKKSKVVVRETVSLRNTGPKRQKRKSKQGKIRVKSMSPAFELGKSLLNPFDCSCCIPDGSTGVGCFSTKNVVQLSTGTGHSCAFILYPGSRGEYFADSGSANSTPTVSGNMSASPSNTTIAGLYSEFRVVSMGFRATFFGSTQTDGGTIIIGQVSSNQVASSLNGASITTLAAQSLYYKIIPLRNGAQATWRPEDMDDMMDFHATGTSAITVGNANDANAPWLYLAVYGATASQQCLTIEYVCNYEGQFVDNTYYPGGISQSKPAVPAEPGWYEKARNLAGTVESLAPVVGSIVSTTSKALQGDYMGALATLANGFAAPGSYGVYNSALGDRSYANVG